MPYLYNDLGSWHFLKDLTQKKTFLSYLRKRSVKTCYYCNSNMNCFPPWLGLCSFFEGSVNYCHESSSDLSLHFDWGVAAVDFYSEPSTEHPQRYRLKKKPPCLCCVAGAAFFLHLVQGGWEAFPSSHHLAEISWGFAAGVENLNDEGRVAYYCDAHFGFVVDKNFESYFLFDVVDHLW